MALSHLSGREMEVVGRCLRAAADGPFFPDWEFHTLFGLERGEVAAVAARWPRVDDRNEDVRLSIRGALNNLIGYPHDEPAALATLVGEPVAELERIFEKWRRSAGSSA